MMQYMTCPVCGASLIKSADGPYECVNYFDCAFEETASEHEARMKREEQQDGAKSDH